MPNYMVNIDSDGNCPEVLNAGVNWLCSNSYDQDAYIFAPAKSIIEDFSRSMFMRGPGQDVLKILLKKQPLVLRGVRLYLFYENRSRMGGEPPRSSSFAGNILLLAGSLENTKNVISVYGQASFCLAPTIKVEALEWCQQLRARIVRTS